MLLYFEYKRVMERFYATNPSSTSTLIRRPNQVWSPENVHTLIKQRSHVNPTAFKEIARQLNSLEERRASVIRTRPYTPVDCQNKWASLFPSSSDVHSTIRYMLKLQKEWPGTVVKVEPTFEKHNIVIGGAHIVWPWARATMKRLAKTVFCDATFHVTIYNYKVVMFTTLDGNHQHRPLMVSFIADSTTVQWQRIFDIFYRYVFVYCS